MKKRFLSITLVLCMLLSIVPLTPVVVNASTTTYTLKNDTNGKLMYGNTAVDETGANGLTVTFDPDNQYAGDTTVPGYILNGGTAGATYRLGDDVTIDKPLIIRGGTKDNPVTLDLCGHVLKYENSNTDTKNSVIVVANDAYFVLQDTVTTPKTRYAAKAGDSDVYSVIGDTVPNSGDYLPVTGGIITGGTGTKIFADADTDIFGGGVFVGSRANFKMTGGNIVGCTVGDKYNSHGGGVFVSAGKNDTSDETKNILTTFAMTGGSIVGCTANHGGGVYERAYTKFTMDENARIAGCTAKNGGGVDIGGSGSTFTMTGGTIENCHATGDTEGGGYGGGVNVGGSSTFTMKGGTIKDCTAKGIGGGVSLDLGSFTMKSGNIENCTANNGGGVGINNSESTFTMKDGTVKGCTAKENGNGVYIGLSGGTMDAQGGSVYGGVHIVPRNGAKLENTSTNGSTIFYSKDGKEAIVKDGSAGDIVGKRVKFMDGETLYAETIAENNGNGKISEPIAPTKDGHTFGGWYTAQTGGKKFEFTTAITADTTLYAQFTLNRYTVTYNAGANGTGTVAAGSKTHGVDFTLSSNTFTRTGYTQTGWATSDGGEKVYNLGGSYTADAAVTLYPVWTINQYTITVKPENGNIDIPIKQDYGTTVTAPPLTRDGYAFDGWDKTFPTTMPAGDMTITAKWKDVTAPTGEIKLGNNGWKTFLNNITFGLFFKDTQEVTITAIDNDGEDVKIEYLLSDKELTAEELATATFTAYSDKFTVEPNNEYVIYAKLTDKSENVAYINSNGIVLDNVAPVISGITNGETYCAAQTVTVSDKYEVTVTVNGEPVTLTNGQFTLSPASGTQTVVAKDQAGNVSAEMIVTVNDGHEGGTATCTKKAECKHCGLEYGDLDPANHENEADEWTTKNETQHKKEWTCCHTVTVELENHEWNENGICTECGYGCIHSGGEATCKSKAKCEHCGNEYGEVDATNHTTLKHIEAKAATTEAEGNIEYWHCEDCGKYFSDKDCKNEITLADTVIAKLTKTESPKTGDNSRMALWFALLFVSGGVLIGTVAYSKKKKYSAK